MIQVFFSKMTKADQLLKKYHDQLQQWRDLGRSSEHLYKKLFDIEKTSFPSDKINKSFDNLKQDFLDKVSELQHHFSIQYEQYASLKKKVALESEKLKKITRTSAEALDLDLICETLKKKREKLELDYGAFKQKLELEYKSEIESLEIRKSDYKNRCLAFKKALEEQKRFWDEKIAEQQALYQEKFAELEAVSVPLKEDPSSTTHLDLSDKCESTELEEKTAQLLALQVALEKRDSEIKLLKQENSQLKKTCENSTFSIQKKKQPVNNRSNPLSVPASAISTDSTLSKLELLLKEKDDEIRLLTQKLEQLELQLESVSLSSDFGVV